MQESWLTSCLRHSNVCHDEDQSEAGRCAVHISLRLPLRTWDKVPIESSSIFGGLSFTYYELGAKPKVVNLEQFQTGLQAMM